MTYPPVPLDATAGELAGQSLALTGSGPDGRNTLVLVAFGKRGRRRIDMRIADTAIRTPMPRPSLAHVPPAATLRELVLAHTGVAAVRASGEIDIKWPGGSRFGPASTTLGMGLLLFAIWLSPGDSGAQFAAFVTCLVAGAAILAATMIAWGRPLTSQLPFTGGPIVHDAHRMPTTSQDPRGSDDFPSSNREDAAPTPQDRVHVVKTEYGRLLTDICYRIENSALFDTAVAETSRFQVALVSWDSLETGALDAERLAAEVEASFAAARTNAEKLGWTHLPATAREPARRARLAAVTALGDGPEGERAAARARVATILGSLALYYLPPVDPDTPRLIGQRRAIEPAP